MLNAATAPRIRLGGSTWIDTIAQAADLVITWGIHGPYELTWTLRLKSKAWRHPLLRSGRRVEVFIGALCIWGGRINDANWDDGRFSAEGYHRESEGAIAINTSGRPTTKPNTAIDKAIDLGVVSWTRIDDWSNTAVAGADGGVGNDDPEQLTLDELLDSRSAELDMEWMVDAERRLVLYEPSTTPDWVVPPGVAAMGTATDERVDQVLLTYRDSTDGDRRRMVAHPATIAAGGIQAKADVGKKIPITPTKAATYAAQIYRRVNGGLDGWTNGVTLGPGQLLTSGGQYANPSHPRGNDMVQLLGIPDPRDGVIGDTTFLADTVAWDVSARTLQLNPIGLADRSFEAIARRVLPKPKKDRSTRAHNAGSAGL